MRELAARGILELVRHNLDPELSPARSVELAQENALPSSQDEAAILDEQQFGVSDERSFEVGVTIPVVVVVVAFARGQAIEEVVPIFLQALVIILIDQDGCGSMGDEHEACALNHSRIRNQFLERVRDFLEVHV